MEHTDVSIDKLAQQCFRAVFRTHTDKPGFHYFNLGKNRTPLEFRTILTELKRELSKLSETNFGKKLSYHWLVRFDQQVNTPFHVDNAAHQSFLLLGYEPSVIESELHIADYHAFAKENDRGSKEYITNFTPVFKGNESLLEPFTTKLKAFDKEAYHIVIMNNSSPTLPAETLGVYHKAVIVEQDLNKNRIVNSMVLNMSSEERNSEDLTREENYLNTIAISK
ncbi:hypothetical protein [Maribacter ulvicola]|uniref:Uncharacterized protein n=1 Tax=Maribacter ulvicola TaxID=228959 RepID=A0A1N6RU41_9FLAO|nr:hypothetical protein [Maribacter ulvicola]SIQ32380.1 hypothetical protein SAMN05421797_1011401 [Maribacter ulvicola]